MHNLRLDEKEMKIVINGLISSIAALKHFEEREMGKMKLNIAKSIEEHEALLKILQSNENIYGV